MKLFDKCKALTDKSNVSYDDEDLKDIILLHENGNTHMTMPTFIKSEFVLRQRSVYYISDLHLVNHIIKKYHDGAEDGEIIRL